MEANWMSINWWIDKEDAVCVYIYTYKASLVTQMVKSPPAMQDIHTHTHTHTHTRILLNHKKNDIMPFAAT